MVYKRSRVVLGTNNLHARYYFSDRLPIAMAAGRPLVHGCEEGMDLVFPSDVSPWWFRTPDQAWSLVSKILSGRIETEERVDCARRFAESRLTFVTALRYMVDVLDVVGPRHTRDKLPPNPWLDEVIGAGDARYG